MVSTLLTRLPTRRYDRRFFDSIAADSDRSAQSIVPRLIELLMSNSVVDVGCGSGSWLAVFRQHGVGDLLGIEGPWISASLPHKSEVAIEIMNLDQPTPLSRHFDLALSLEVAEHLTPGAAYRFVQFLTSLADVVVFSAAVPMQGGFYHLNEQWPSYWDQYFSRVGYDCFDVIRPMIWDDDDIAPHYAQNMFVYLNAGRRPELAHRLSGMPSFTPAGAAPRSLIHPRTFRDAVLLRHARPRNLVSALPPAVFQALSDRVRRYFG